MLRFGKACSAAETGGAPGGAVAPAEAVAAAPAAPAAAEPAPAPQAAPEPAPAAAPAPTENSPSLLAAADDAATRKDGGKEPVPTETKPADEGAKAPEPAAKVEGAEPAVEGAKADEPPPLEPVKYESFQLPDGIKLDGERLKAFEEIAGPARVPQEIAQKFLDMHLAEVKAAQDAAGAHQREVWTGLNDRWKEELRSDPEIGGNRIETSLGLAKSVLRDFARTPAEYEALLKHVDANGMGNFPPFVGLLHNLATKLNLYQPENRMVPAPSGNPSKDGDRAARWYGKSQKGAGA